VVEFGCDSAWAFTRGEVCKNATNHHGLRIPTKPAMHSNTKPATCSNLKPAGVPI
jgi:hypothetical protein